MRPAYIRTGKREEADAYADTKGHWTVANIRQSIGWTKEPVTIDYEGRKFLLLPEDAEHFPAIALPGNSEEGRRAILEFASALSWSSVGSVTVEHWGGGGRPHRAGKQRTGQISATYFRVSYLPSPSQANQKLALALFNEGSGLANVHVAYSFLSYYKIINLVSGHSGDAQKAWINKHVGAMTHHRGKDRLEELKKAGTDVGQYLYQSCRCAIAHAGDPRNPVIDPHDREEQRRLYSDLPLIITLAEIALEEIGIETSQTVYTEHRYELSGFEEILPADLVALLKAGQTPKDDQVEMPETLSLRMWGKAPYPPLEKMKPLALHGENGVLAIKCKSSSPGWFADVTLDFPAYRLKAEVFGHEVHDDGSPEFIEAYMAIEQFIFDWNCNGCLEVWAEGEKCLGRCDAFIPVNVYVRPEVHIEEMAKLRAEVDRRRQKPNQGPPA